MFKLLALLALSSVPLGLLGSFGTIEAASSQSKGIAMSPKQPHGDLRCEIRARQSGGGVGLEAFAIGKKAVSGSYEFEVVKQGGGGSSNITQGGDFELQPNQQSVLGEVDLGLGRGASYLAKLTLTWKGGKTGCELKYPDKA